MAKLECFINSEKELYGKLFSDIEFGINNVCDLVSAETLRNRKYYTRISVLKKYMELLNSVELEKKEKGFFKLFNSDKYIDLLSTYKNDNKEAITQLQSCGKCQCLNCTRECEFDSCKRCMEKSSVAFCDHTRGNVSLQHRQLNLVNDKTSEEDTYDVLGIVQDVQKDKRYILIDNISDHEKFILYYYPGISEDTYGEITDEEDFNFAAEIYENC